MSDTTTPTEPLSAAAPSSATTEVKFEDPTLGMTHEPGTPGKKTSAATKPKSTKSKAVKAKVEQGESSEQGEDQEATGEPKTPKTPKSAAKKKVATPKPKTPAKRAGDDGEGTPKSSAKKPRAAPKNDRVDRTGIPTSMEEMTEADKMLWEWKKEGKSWAEINQEWERITGNKPGNSTLPNRYSRLKAAVSTMSTTDTELMKKSVVAVEQAIEVEYKEALAKKWKRVAQYMKDNGAEADYEAAAIEKQWKKTQALVAKDVTTTDKSDIGDAADTDEAGQPSEAEKSSKAVKDKTSKVKDESSDAEAED